VTSPILPGAAIGVLGSGQLGRMFALAARRMGYRVHVFSPERGTPAGSVADVDVSAPYDDLDAVRDFARGVSVVTFEFENVPAATAAAAAEAGPVRPDGHVLHTTQDRAREKRFLVQAGLPVPSFEIVEGPEDLDAAIARVGVPAVLKTTRFGYDGKGQARVDAAAAARDAWDAVGGGPCVLEAFVDFACEVSVVGARGLDGRIVHYGAVENRHARHVLDLTLAPAPLPPEVSREAERVAVAVLEALDVVGVACVEMFVTRAGGVLVNEVAPRTHNSGHFTIEACATSQFEQQLRAVCGLPLGPVAQRAPAAMANLLGDLWAGGEPDWAAALAVTGVALHLYGKAAPRPGRKMGHLTALADTAGEAARLVLEARERLLH
jgi:5-(carboxyamino)imidazole ribonucleotide synthase